MDKIKVGVAGLRQEGKHFVNFFSQLKQVEAIGITVNDDNEIDLLLDNHDFDVIIVTQDAHEKIALSAKGIDNKKLSIFKNITQLVQILIDEKEELRRIKGELSAVLSSVQESIEVVDNNGIIKYVNPAFTRVTGISEDERIGKNLFAVSPFGALARSLKNKESVFGYRAKVGGSNVEVISNASPIIVDGDITGAVVVFQPINDIYKLMEELNKSNAIIENLYAQIGQISGAKYTFPDLIGNCETFKTSVNIAKKAAFSDATVLILGESGTGKELYAHAIHQSSLRRDKPFIKVNCAAIPENLLESEFFGHEKGAFTGALKTKLGKLELANGGTLFLDEIGDMNLVLQAKLLRVLQERELERVGGTQTIPVDVRFIAATNRNLLKLIEQGKFREDLYYRLNVIEIQIPPLRERKKDIQKLAKHMITKFNRRLGKMVTNISEEALQVLLDYDWPGNIRELENVLERAMVVVEGREIRAEDISEYVKGSTVTSCEDIPVISLERMEKILIEKALNHYGDTLEGKKEAAAALNISLATLYNKIKKYNSNS